MGNITSTPNGIAGQVSRRKLNFFWIVDVSGSMEGSKIQMVNWAIKEVIPALKRIEDEERIKILIRTILFGNYARWRGGDKPVELSQFDWKDLDSMNEVTATAEAIELLCSALDLEKMGRRNAPPVCILLSDGYCTDPEAQYDAAIEKLNSHPWGAKAVRISIGIGEREEYDKEKLDEFITPYLRYPKEETKKPVTTLPADSPRKLIQYILTASTEAARSSSTIPLVNEFAKI